MGKDGAYIPNIMKLPIEMPNRIAAGEVIERPASVVKELVENAMDAGATSITVEMEAGGIPMLSVTDNGCGIAPEDIETAFLRNATSKIRSPEDLFGIRSMGFRGEALAATAAVSRICVISRTTGEELGVELTLEGGAVTGRREVGSPVGTRIVVQDLFFNTPVRHKFLKKDASEAGYVLAVCQRAALSRPDISFRLVRDGNVELHTTGDGKLYSAIYCLFGRSMALGLIPVEFSSQGVTLSGFASRPGTYRGSRSMQHFFVNTRPVRNRTVQAALEEAYRGRLVSGRFPIAFLELTLDPELVDVNVHPTKAEIKFAMEKPVFDAVYYGIRSAIDKDAAQAVDAVQAEGTAETEETVRTEDVAPTRADTDVSVVSQPPAPAVQTVFPNMSKSEERIHVAIPPVLGTSASSLTENIPSVHKITPNSTYDHAIIDAKGQLTRNNRPAAVRSLLAEAMQEGVMVREKPADTEPQFLQDTGLSLEPAAPSQTVPEPAEEPFRVIGEVFGVYILVEKGETLLLIDKHAAHERIRYEALLSSPDRVPSQSLLTPPVITLDGEEKALLTEQQTLVESLGFVLEDFGGLTLLARAIPSVYRPEEAEQAVIALAATLAQGNTETERRDKMLKQLACKKAIRSGDRSDMAELVNLTETVLRDERIRFCPHGRPILVPVTKKELEKRFSRIV